jgi:predicted PhzF superfamily epimerase YddE/YHI9
MRIYQVDAFTDRIFSGNPAGVCLLPAPRDERWMQNVAAEMNLSETAFLVPRPDGFDLRWFTPALEVDLCGHATLASAHILWETGAAEGPLRFLTKSGWLSAAGRDGLIELDFPVEEDHPVEAPADLREGLGVPLQYVGQNRFDYLAELASENAVRTLKPDFGRLARLSHNRGVMVTSRASTPGYDFVSRFFAPACGIDEDPVTGSAHCCLGPYWRRKLGKDSFSAHQASARGGDVQVTVAGDRVLLGGRAVTVFVAELREA